VRCSCSKGHTLGSTNLLSRARIKVAVLEREEERAQALDLKEAFGDSEWPTAQGGRWGTIYIPHLKKELLGGFPLDKSNEAIKQVQ
jgi:hypothetical protein